MLMKCQKLANWKSELKEAYNKMADKEALKECFEDQSNNCEKINDFLDKIIK